MWKWYNVEYYVDICGWIFPQGILPEINDLGPVWPDEAIFRHLGYFWKAKANFENEKFALKIGEFLGYFWRHQHFQFFTYKSHFKTAFDVGLLRFQIWFDVDIFEFENGVDVDILALKTFGRIF
jgi:hypothetical protein